MITTRTRALVAVILTYMLFAILLNSVGTVILQSIASLDQTKSSAAILEAFKDLPIAITSFLVASFLPRFGLKNSLGVACFLVGAACVAMPPLPYFAMTKLLFAITGISFALVKVSAYSIIGLIAKDEADHASLMSYIEGLFMVGVLSGYWIFSVFIDSANPSSLGWLNVYWLLAAISFAICAIVFTTPLDESAAKPTEDAGAADFFGMFRLLAKPLVLVFIISAFLYVLIEQAIGTWLPTFNNEVLHVPQAMSVLAASLFAFATAAGRLGAGFVLRFLSWFPLLVGCVAMMALLVLLTLPLTQGLAPNPDMTWGSAPLAAFLMPLVGLFLAPIYPLINSRILSALPKPAHAQMTGLIVVFSALGGTTGSYITGQIFAAMGGQTAFYTSLLPMAALLIALIVFRRLSGGAAAPIFPGADETTPARSQ